MKMRMFLVGIATLILSSNGLAEVKRVLLVGKTGSGKTSFVQMAHEHMRGANFKDDRDFIVEIVNGNTNIGQATHATKDSTQSQTKEISTYSEVNTERGWEVEFVDTQGLFDTTGSSLLEAQKQLAAYLAENPIHAIALVISASDSRLTQQVEEIFTLLNGVFGDTSVRNHFFAFVTYSASENENVSLLLKQYITQPKERIFFFDNSCIPAFNKSQVVGSELREMVWRMHRESFFAMAESVQSLPQIQSIVFRQRAALLTEAEGLITESVKDEAAISEAERALSVAVEDGKLITAYNYKKWSCGQVGENLATNSRSDPVLATKSRGGFAGLMGGEKTYISHYVTTNSCASCGADPAGHTSDRYVKLRGAAETKMATTAQAVEVRRTAAAATKQRYISRCEQAQARLNSINKELSTSGRARDYIADLKKMKLNDNK